MKISFEKKARVLPLLAMAWDGQWFLKTCEAYGWEEATRLNAQVRAAFARIEMKTMLRALGKRVADDLADAVQIINTYFQDILAAGFDAEFTVEKKRVEIAVSRCAALSGAKRARLERHDQACIACQGLWPVYFEVLLPDTAVEVEIKEQMGYGAPQCHIVISEETMMTSERSKHSVLSSEGIRELLEGGVDNLSEDERALLLALITVETEAGTDLDEEERAAVEQLKAQVEGYDTEELAQAMKHLVTAKSREGRKLEWPGLKQRLRKLRSFKK